MAPRIRCYVRVASVAERKGRLLAPSLGGGGSLVTLPAEAVPPGSTAPATAPITATTEGGETLPILLALCEDALSLPAGTCVSVHRMGAGQEQLGGEEIHHIAQVKQGEELLVRVGARPDVGQ